MNNIPSFSTLNFIAPLTIDSLLPSLAPYGYKLGYTIRKQALDLKSKFNSDYKYLMDGGGLWTSLTNQHKPMANLVVSNGISTYFESSNLTQFTVAAVVKFADLGQLQTGFDILMPIFSITNVATGAAMSLRMGPIAKSYVTSNTGSTVTFPKKTTVPYTNGMAELGSFVVFKVYLVSSSYFMDLVIDGELVGSLNFTGTFHVLGSAGTFQLEIGQENTGTVIIGLTSLSKLKGSIGCLSLYDSALTTPQMEDLESFCYSILSTTRTPDTCNQYQCTLSKLNVPELAIPLNRPHTNVNDTAFDVSYSCPPGYVFEGINWRRHTFTSSIVSGGGCVSEQIPQCIPNTNNFCDQPCIHGGTCDCTGSCTCSCPSPYSGSDCSIDTTIVDSIDSPSGIWPTMLDFMVVSGSSLEVMDFTSNGRNLKVGRGVYVTNGPYYDGATDTAVTFYSPEDFHYLFRNDSDLSWKLPNESKTNQLLLYANSKYISGGIKTFAGWKQSGTRDIASNIFRCFGPDQIEITSSNDGDNYTSYLADPNSRLEFSDGSTNWYPVAIRLTKTPLTTTTTSTTTTTTTTTTPTGATASPATFTFPLVSSIEVKITTSETSVTGSAQLMDYPDDSLFYLGSSQVSMACAVLKLNGSDVDDEINMLKFCGMAAKRSKLPISPSLSPFCLSFITFPLF